MYLYIFILTIYAHINQIFNNNKNVFILFYTSYYSVCDFIYLFIYIFINIYIYIYCWDPADSLNTFLFKIKESKSII